MCRFLVYKGSKPIILSKLITEPSHSILTQSYDSRLRLDSRRPVNGDGFGVGWYTEPELGPDPCVFTSTLPAWNCVNLERLAPKTASTLIFAHVRATTEGSLAENNCHPFQHNTLMWMHNGNIGAWKYVKRPLADSLSDKWYLGVKGGTDSEWAFALFLDTLEREEGVDPSSEPEGGFDTKTLRRAMKKTIAKINAFVKAVPAEHHLADVETRSLLNFAVTDGHSVIVTRYVSSKTDAAASLYYSSGTAWVEGKTKGQFRMERRDKASDVVLVASEPLTFERHNWLSVPTNTIVTICNQTVYVRPIKDEYYDPDPSTERSTGFARSKGLVAKAPGGGTATPSTMVGTPVQSTEVEAVDGSYVAKEDLDKYRSKMADLHLQSGTGLSQGSEQVLA
ncbi:glutamine amidotransferase subunit [Elasticomyces elasticus]|uniref:Glutamine amidotransferase subunit n=1 Tax=Exophiala sideris TaxID=1016849 RepID=A0ABR0J2Z1_9EURO|nr:glutamine amidotransferase subunit [Elasticomyces elasticus]KAK5024614.1 glutamine amidotransferase subunit [Exophiala sideris]KAK5030707.1 glutamine amidotransferase subunit [Exophiala sideris]KAK5054247.1 glutamine amidotransferase subunit [Exophiala sideris]KAK5179649.1 glutamine amidotransferase subunit [Eurotiomycetes sp. CCFEE 6388]